MKKRNQADFVEQDESGFELLRLGLQSEGEEAWEKAAGYYRQVLALSPRDVVLRYFGNNNLAYSLIQMNRFAEAEKFCHQAIGIDGRRHNAHKNLGLSYQGQERWLEATFSFAKASQIYPSDTRAWHLLSALLGARPYLLSQSEELRCELTQLNGSLN
ncbi:MAG: hypothetical protein HQL43_12110 [Alphaproteobacteria bacterium]|nr:hypothetical protein [Alphaproteobacteria bacterium]